MRRGSPYLAALAALLVGCAAQLKVQGWRAAPTPLGDARRLTVIKMEGSPSGRERVVRQLVGLAREGGYFTAQDRSDERAGAPAPGEVLLAINVAQLRAQLSERTQDVTQSGIKTEQRERHFIANADLEISAVDAAGTTRVDRKPYAGRAEAQSEEEALEGAARMALFAFLAEVSPVAEERYLQLDEDDEGQRALLAQAKGGELANAIAGLEAYVAGAPDNAPGHYNLGLLLDADGQCARALPHYQRAAQLSGKRLHREAAAGGERRCR